MEKEKILIIGSAAMRFHGVAHSGDALDVDLICSQAALQKAIKNARYNDGAVVREIRPTPGGVAVFMAVEGEKVIWDVMLTDPVEGVREYYTDSTALILCKCFDDATPVVDTYSEGLDVRVASPNTLLLIKMSHRYKKNTPTFRKTMDDIWGLRFAGARVVDQVLFQIREQATYDYGHPKLNVDKKDFFKDDVPYKYDHDSIHEAVAVDGTPAYTKYMVDGEQVLTSRTKFDALDHRTKLLGVLEESYVLALERSIIPHNSSPSGAFRMALSKVCTSITSGWFREFAWEHYHEVMALYNPDFVDKFHAALLAGRIRPYKGRTY